MSRKLEAPCNHQFAYIAGHTESGVPFGVTWEEMEGGLGAEGVPFIGDEFRRRHREALRAKRGD